VRACVCVRAVCAVGGCAVGGYGHWRAPRLVAGTDQEDLLSCARHLKRTAAQQHVAAGAGERAAGSPAASLDARAHHAAR